MTSQADLQNPARKNAPLHGWALATLISLLVSLAIISPFIRFGSATGHDFLFHASCWLDAATQWKHGILYPRWAEWANYGFGEPRFIFYPPFSWMLGAALGLLISWSAAPAIFVVLTQTLAGTSAFALGRRVMSRRAAYFCAACFAANPYALIIVYLRSDFAELLANAFFPLLFLAALRMCGWIGEESGPVNSVSGRAIVAFSAVLAAIWLSNAPAGVMACYSAAAIFGYAALALKSWKPLISGATGLALGLGFTGFYLLPAAFEQRWVNIAQALAPGLLPSENFLFTVINDPEHTLFNWIVSGAAIFLMVVAGLAAISAHRLGKDQELPLEDRVWQVLLLLAAVASVLMLRFTTVLWNILPKLKFVQFPWRWLAILAVPFAVFLGNAIARKKWGWVWGVLCLTIMGGIGAGVAHRAWWYRNDIPTLRNAIGSGLGYEGTDEYDPNGDDHTNVPIAKAPPAQVMDTDSTPGPDDPPTVHVEQWKPEYKEVSVRTKDAFALGLRLLNYPAWEVRVNGAVVKTLSGEDYNQMLVELRPGESHIVVRFRRTWDRTLGGVLSICSALVGLWMFRKNVAG